MGGAALRRGHYPPQESGPASRSSASRLPGTRPIRSPRATSIRATGSGWRSAEARALPSSGEWPGQQIQRIEAARDTTSSIAKSQASGPQEVGGAALRRGHYPPQESGPEDVREAEIGTFETSRQPLGMSASLIGHFWSSTFRLSTTAVSMSLAGSRARASLRNRHQGPSIMGFEDEAEQSYGRPCRQKNGRSKQTCELTSSIVPRGTSFHRSVEL